MYAVGSDGLNGPRTLWKYSTASGKAYVRLDPANINDQQTFYEHTTTFLTDTTNIAILSWQQNPNGNFSGKVVFAKDNAGVLEYIFVKD